MKNKNITPHLALFGAGAMWGLMSPIGKLAMDGGMTSLSLATLRMAGAAVCFWIASLFAPREKVSRKDMILLFGAAMLSIVFNQGLFIFGLSLTSPVDATIITTSLPLITMALAALFLKEPITTMKAGGVILGGAGALILILSNHSPAAGEGSIWGDLMCFGAQISFACYLTIFRGLISRYHTFTLMKWMFTYATVFFLPVSYGDLSDMARQSFDTSVWLQAGYVVLFGTFFAYMLIMVGQKRVRPTIVSMYNYIQPIVGTAISVMLGIGTFDWSKGLATAFIFFGVYLVTRSKARSTA